MFVTDERVAAERAELIEFYRAMGLEVSTMELVNGFHERETVQYRLNETDPPLEREIRFFLRVWEADRSPEDSSYSKTYAVFVELEPDPKGGQRTIVHRIEITDLSHVRHGGPADAPTSE